jgi:hypothetical protein
MGVKLHVDLETLQLIQGPGQRSPVAALRFKRGDAARLEVVFLRDGTTPEAIGDPQTLEMHFGVKPRNRYDVGYMVHTSYWNMPTTGEEIPVYECSPSFNTVELDSALGVNSTIEAEKAEITLMGEITWREGAGEPTSTRTFLVVVENDVNRGTEGMPTSANPPYPAPEQIALLSDLAAAIGAHEAAVNPHPQYLNVVPPQVRQVVINSYEYLVSFGVVQAGKTYQIRLDNFVSVPQSGETFGLGYVASGAGAVSNVQLISSSYLDTYIAETGDFSAILNGTPGNESEIYSEMTFTADASFEWAGYCYFGTYVSGYETSFTVTLTELP